MRYEEIKDRNDKDFKRLTGVEHQTFQQMVTVLESELANFGRPPKLSREDQLLLTLMYWREYRTQFHIEDAMIHSGQFQLPGKKSLQPSDTVIEIILVDATEQPIERPKKSNVATTAAKRNDTLRKRK